MCNIYICMNNTYIFMTAITSIELNILSKTIWRPSAWIKTNHRNIEGIRSKGKKCNKKSSSIQNESVVKKQRMNMVVNIRCRQKFGYLTMQIIFADRRGWDPISDVSFHFYVYNVYSFHIFIRFSSPSFILFRF